MIKVAADGSSLGNPGPSGWAWIAETGQFDQGGWRQATNNIAELTAVLQLLESTRINGLSTEPLQILCDSQYTINSLSKWMPSWKKRGWKKSSPGPIKNLELLQRIDQLLQGRKVEFVWVKGHSGHDLNEQADTLANTCAQKYQQGLEVQPGSGFGKSTPRTTPTGKPVTAPEDTLF